jgi:hypothetical protein
MFNNYGDTFVEKCIRGKVLLEEIDDFVDRWHEGKYKGKLHDFLGMTWKEYSLWVVDPEALPFIITAHREHRDIENLLDELKRLPLAARSDQPAKAMKVMQWLRKRGKRD